MTNFLDILEQDLNSQQRQAVLEKDHPVLVLSGAGTGKTRTISYKVAYLVLVEGYELHRILALTFTNKAAREMRERTLALVQDFSEGPPLSIREKQLYIGTFHSICAKILRWHGKLLGYTPSFSIFDEDDQRSLIKRLVKEAGFQDLPQPKEILRFIGFWKNDFLSPEDAFSSQQTAQPLYRNIAKIYELYQKALLQSNAMDFDDIQLNVIFLFQQHPDIQEFWRKQFQAVLVDEFQDTNKVQYLLLRMLMPENGKNVTFVGDDDQSIYSFRGAYIGNILNLSSDFPSLRVVKLEENYRSTSTILQLANHVIAENQNRLGKELFSHFQEERALPILFMAEDEAQEVQFCMEALESKNSNETVAIIYRTNRQSIIFEQEFIRRGIYYTLLGGRKFYERKEIRDIVAYLRLLWNPYDQAAFSRVINTPGRGIGDVSRQKLLEAMQKDHLSIFEILETLPKSIKLSQRSREEFVQLRKILLELVDVGKEQPEELLKILLGAIEYPAYLEEYDKKDLSKVEDRLLNLESLEADYRKFCADGTPQEFLERLSLADSSDIQKEHGGGSSPSIVLTSVHGCKGLEFDWVFVVGLAQEIFPHALSIETQEQLEEERRLFYVAITRAKSHLFLVSPRTVFFRGYSRWFDMSQFIENIPENLVTREQSSSPPPSSRWYKDFL